MDGFIFWKFSIICLLSFKFEKPRENSNDLSVASLTAVKEAEQRSRPRSMVSSPKSSQGTFFKSLGQGVSLLKPAQVYPARWLVYLS